MSVVPTTVAGMKMATARGADELVLDQWQQAVCELPAGSSAMVVGAPGTGKTTTLLHYAATLVERDGLSVDELLVLSPNRNTATALRDRLALAIGRTTEGPLVRSVPSVAFEIVSEALGTVATLLTGAEHDQLIADLLAGEIADGTDSYWPSALSRELRGLRSFRDELRELMMRAAERGITPARIAELGAQHGVGNWLAVAEFLGHYQQAKLAAHATQFDAAELVAYAARLVRDAEQVTLRDRLRVVLIDDAQEATASTISLLEAFAERGIAIVGFGNPDVASSGFRGGRTDLVGGFDQVIPVRYRDRLRVLEPLGRSYRMGEQLSAPYNDLVEAIGTARAGGQRRPRQSAAAVPGSLQRASAPSAYTQVRLIADDLRERHLSGEIPWSEMAVFTRSSSAARELEAQLGRLGVPTRRSVSQLVLRSEPGAAWLLRAMQLAYSDDPFASPSPEHAALAAELLVSPLGQLDHIAVRRLRLELRRQAFAEQPEHTHSADALLCSAFVHPVEFDQLEGFAAQRAARVARAVQQARAIAATGSVEEVLWSLWTASRVQPRWVELAEQSGPLAEEANRSLDAVVALQAAARRFVERRPNDHGSLFVAELLGADLPEDSLARERNRNTVLVTTPAAVIGRQFRHVVIASLQEGVWPDLRLRNSLLDPDRLIELDQEQADSAALGADRAAVRSDEFRLFALAYSRASESVLLSAVHGDDDLPSVLWSLTDTPARSFRPQPWTLRQLVAELRRTLTSSFAPNSTVPASVRDNAAAALAQLAAAGVPGASPDGWYGMLSPSTVEPILEGPARISPSSLEKLEQSSLNWFIDRYAPEPSDSARSIGDLVHTAMEQADPAHPDLAAMERQIDERWPELRFEADWQQIGRRRAVSRMLRRVCEYLEQAAGAGRTVVGVETPFEFQLDGVIVNGRIDRIEQQPDGALFVIDLKTGRLNGLPGPKQVAEHLQLKVYQLAIDRHALEDVPAGPSAGAALLAVDTDEAGGVVRRQAPLDAAELDDIIDTIQHAAGEMLASQFRAAKASETGFANARRYRIHVLPGVSE